MVLLDGEFSQLIDGSTRFMRQLRQATSAPMMRNLAHASYGAAHGSLELGHKQERGYETS